MPFGELEGAWRGAFDLAWQALRAGSVPVGAVLVDEAGDVVAQGRNRIFESDAPPGQLAHSFLAHAELNALVGLDPARRYGGHVLYTTLEPCVLCMGAAMMVMVGSIRYASNDVYAGASHLRSENRRAERQPLVIEGPLGGVVGDLGELMHVAHFLSRKPDSALVEAYRERSPRIVELAERVDLVAAGREGATLDDAIALVLGCA